MGTVGYMSPEQVRGEKAGAPSDIFSLGCVLYEAVTGRRAFPGKSAGDTMAAILKEDPPAIADTGIAGARGTGTSDRALSGEESRAAISFRPRLGVCPEGHVQRGWREAQHRQDPSHGMRLRATLRARGCRRDSRGRGIVLLAQSHCQQHRLAGRSAVRQHGRQCRRRLPERRNHREPDGQPFRTAQLESDVAQRGVRVQRQGSGCPNGGTGVGRARGAHRPDYAARRQPHCERGVGGRRGQQPPVGRAIRSQAGRRAGGAKRHRASDRGEAAAASEQRPDGAHDEAPDRQPRSVSALSERPLLRGSIYARKAWTRA